MLVKRIRLVGVVARGITSCEVEGSIGQVERCGLFSHSDMEILVIEAGVSSEAAIRIAVRLVWSVTKDSDLFRASSDALVHLDDGGVVPLHRDIAGQAFDADGSLLGSSVDLGLEGERFARPVHVALLRERVLWSYDADLEDGWGEEAQRPFEALLVGQHEGIRRLFARRLEIRQRPFYKHFGVMLCGDVSTKGSGMVGRDGQ